MQHPAVQRMPFGSYPGQLTPDQDPHLGTERAGAGDQRRVGLDPVGPQPDDLHSRRCERGRIPDPRREGEDRRVRQRGPRAYDLVGAAQAEDDLGFRAIPADVAQDRIDRSALLDVDEQPNRLAANQRDHLTEGRHAFAVADTAGPDPFERGVIDEPRAIGGPVERLIVNDDELMVPGIANVELDHRDPALDRLAERRERVFGSAFAQAAMGGDDDRPGRSGTQLHGQAGEPRHHQPRRRHPPASSPRISVGKNPSCAAPRSARDALNPGPQTALPPSRPIGAAKMFASVAASITLCGSVVVTRARPWSSPNRIAAGLGTLGRVSSAPMPPASAISAIATSAPPSEMSCAAVTAPAAMSWRNSSPSRRSTARSTAGGLPSRRLWQTSSHSD